MKHRGILSACAGLLLLAGAQAATDQEVDARKEALEIAGAFSNDGFKIRDGNWAGKLEPKGSVLIQVNLYAGNEYWFCAAGDANSKRLGLALYNEAGVLMTTDPYADGSKAAAGFSPEASGPYYVRIEELDGVPATVCLLYSYK